MRNKLPLFLLLLVILSLRATAQQAIELTLIDLKTNEPVPFANIVYGSHQLGTMSNINGRFQLLHDSETSDIRISCMGYKTKSVVTSGLNPQDIIYLEPSVIELTQVNIFPGKNPALTIMEKVYENRDLNNPDKAVDYSCIIYHKMTFFLNVPDTLKTIDKDQRKLIEFSKNNHLLLIESVTEKKHLAPDKTNEKMISGRVSGLQQPSLAILPTQIQPFSFYQENIRLLDNDYTNPISQQGLKNYFFLIEDTLLNASGDTLFYISFEPRKQSTIRGMKGSMHVHIPTYGIKTVNAETIQEHGSLSLAIKQNYEQTDSLYWFPDQLESRMQITKTATGQSYAYPLIGVGKSSVTAIKINPKLNEKEFSNIQFIDESGYKTLPPIDNYRIEPLSARDSATYHLIDSLGRKMKLDAMINFQKNLIDGFIPMGYLKLDVKKLVGYNQYEGFRLGIGLWTSEKLSNKFSTGGYYTHSYKPDDNNYGAGFRLNLNKKRQTEWDVNWDKSLNETGSFSFLDGYESTSAERYKRIYISTMDRIHSGSTAIRTRMLQYFKTELAYKYEESTPVIPYEFFTNSNEVQHPFTNHESVIKVKWAHKETFMFTNYGLTSNGTNYPTVWANFTYGRGQQIESFSFRKIEGQIEKTVRTSPATKMALRLTSGTIFGNYPASKLYSSLGTNSRGIGIETPFSFATMHPNEFAASRFTSFFIRNTYFTGLNKPGNFKPEITLSSSFIFGDANGFQDANNIRTFDKGYYESGIYFGNLLRQLIFKYGISVHYRYGPYKLPKEIDNWAFKIGLAIGL
jgi:hypothetical protein